MESFASEFFVVEPATVYIVLVVENSLVIVSEIPIVLLVIYYLVFDLNPRLVRHFYQFVVYVAFVVAVEVAVVAHGHNLPVPLDALDQDDAPLLFGEAQRDRADRLPRHGRMRERAAPPGA